ncbi:helix-turn-helix transcriptional regulator [Microbacterium sp. A93]|uniref:helix-turn-helix transcriptional regulator n=1 Tax=Microbacterium sp. A93 TaxID=3450716 RepID=UPI003F4360EA
MDTPTPQGNLDDLALLSDDVRRRLYEFTAARSGVTREEVATATGISRSLAAYHLDKLADAGMLDVGYARTNGRSGPGSGRPAKRYSRSDRELSVSFPPRNYSLLAQVLATAVEAAPSGELRAALDAAAEQEGRALGESLDTIQTALSTAGFEPVTTDNGDIVLQNCPFHSIVQQHTELACNLNHAFIRGTLAGANDDRERAELCPGEGRCCVIVHPAPPHA